jgi:uncharacterized protein YegP (UPF0339 family)
MAAKFELISKNGKFRFNLKSGNGQVVLSSETYNSKASAKNGIASVKKNGAKSAAFERRQSKDGSPYFVLLAANNEIIGKSQMYASKSSMENGIQSVIKNAKATIVEVEE